MQVELIRPDSSTHIDCFTYIAVQNRYRYTGKKIRGYLPSYTININAVSRLKKPTAKAITCGILSSFKKGTNRRLIAPTISNI